MDEFKRPTLTDIIRSQEFLRNNKERIRAQYRVKLPKPISSDIAAIVNFMLESIRIGQFGRQNRGRKAFQIAETIFQCFWKRGGH